MTEKTLDEKVAEALGWRLVLSHFYEVGFATIAVLPDTTDVNFYENFFTQSIANCKKYIEPVLVAGDTNLSKERDRHGNWLLVLLAGVNVHTRTRCIGKGETEEIAYCNALLGFERE